MDRDGHSSDKSPDPSDISGGTHFPTDDAPIPLDFHGVIVTGPAWARKLHRFVAPLRPALRAGGRLALAAAIATLAVGMTAVAVGRADAVGLSDTSLGYRAVYVVLIVGALLILGAISADVLSMGPRTRRARTAWIRSGSPHSQGSAGRAGSNAHFAASWVTEGLNLPDIPNPRDHPNGLSDHETTASGMPI